MTVNNASALTSEHSPSIEAMRHLPACLYKHERHDRQFRPSNIVALGFSPLRHITKRPTTPYNNVPRGSSLLSVGRTH